MADITQENAEQAISDYLTERGVPKAARQIWKFVFGEEVPEFRVRLWLAGMFKAGKLARTLHTNRKEKSYHYSMAPAKKGRKR